MDDERLVLDRRIRKDLEVLEKLWEELAGASRCASTCRVR